MRLKMGPNGPEVVADDAGDDGLHIIRIMVDIDEVRAVVEEVVRRRVRSARTSKTQAAMDRLIEVALEGDEIEVAASAMIVSILRGQDMEDQCLSVLMGMLVVTDQGGPSVADLPDN